MIWLIGVVIIAMGLALWTVISALQAEREYPPTGAFLSVEGTQLHYVRRGSGPPVVVLHGSDGSLLDFADTVLESTGRTQSRPLPYSKAKEIVLVNQK